MDIISAQPQEAAADLLIVPGFEDQLSRLDRWSGATAGEVARALASKEFSGKPYEMFYAPITAGGYRAKRLVLVGAGPSSGLTIDRVRRISSAAALAAKQRRIATLTLLAEPPIDTVDMVQAAVEGLTLAEFDGAQYKTMDYEPFTFEHVAIVLPGATDATRAAAERGRILGESCNVARGLANEPANHLRPAAFAERIGNVARESGLDVEILDETELARLGMGLLLGVGQGSDQPPRLVRLRYHAGNAAAQPVLGLVGKGITFDTGGISIKPADGMERMKDDMAGGAAVLGAMRAIAAIGAPISVVGVIPIAENMPSGRALRPGDVLQSACGKTVEVLNTDAEGRLILGDALWYAQQQGATHLVDIATLTGAITVALGKFASGLFGTPDSWVEHVRAVAEKAGDRCWPMPLFDEYKDQLRSEIADMVNTGGRQGGAITAALFLKEFTGGLPWAHIDVAGTAWLEDARPYLPKGASGIGVRTLAELAFTAQIWSGIGQEPRQPTS